MSARRYRERIAQLRAEAAAETRHAARKELLLTASVLEERLARIGGAL